MASPFFHELQQQAGSLRRLARDLVGATEADDVLQDAAVEVLRATPSAVGNPAAWLHTVVAHMAGKHRRAAAHRRRHEQRAAAMQAEHAFAAAGAESADTLRWLSERISDLPEPYRSTVVARYLRDETPSSIAAATGVPVRTVKTRLQRGLALLRESCGEHGCHWRPVLVVAFALPRRGVVAASTAAGPATWMLGMTMTTKTKLLISSLLLVVGFGGWLLLPPAVAPVPLTQTPQGYETADLVTVPPQARPTSVSIDASTAVREQVKPSQTTTTPAAVTLQGRVVDSRGQVLADVPIAILPFDAATTDLQAEASACTTKSDAFGLFQFAAAGEPCAPAAGPGWFTLRTTPWRPGDADAQELLVIAATAVSVTGRILRSDDGAPLGDVVVAPDMLRLTEFPSALAHTVAPALPPTRSSATGEYRLAHSPLAAGVQFGFFHDGFPPQWVPSEQAAGGRLDVFLEPLSAVRGRIHGRVRDASGQVADAVLELGNRQQTKADALGEFTFELPPSPSRLVAVRRGWQPVVIENVGVDTLEVDVLFVQRARTIAGVLQFADGRPAPGWRIDLVDATRGYGYRPIEFDSQSNTAASDCFSTTDEAGQFVVGGLRDRTYQLLAYEPDQILNVTSVPIRSGSTGVVLTLPAEANGETLRGIVVDRRGLPIAGATVGAFLSAACVEGMVAGPSTTSNAEGTFVLERAPRGGVQMNVSIDGWVSVMVPIEAWRATDADLRITLDRLCAVRIEGEPDLVVQFLDADGQTLWAECTNQSMSFATSEVTLFAGRSPVMTLPESTATMLWKRRDREVGRTTVALDPRPNAVTLLVAGH